MKKQAVYQSRIEEFEQQKRQLKSKLLKLSIIRILVFLTCLAGIYFFWTNTIASIGLVFGFIISFLVLVRIYSSQKRELDKTKLIIEINQNEIKALDGDLSPFDNGEIYKDSSHAYSEDIDLFGEQSFFQYLNRTGLIQGKNLLTNLLKSNNTQNILQKQDAVKDLAERINFRQNYTAEAKLIENQKELKNVLTALEKHQPTIPKFLFIVSIVFSFLSLAVIGLYSFEIISEMQLLLWIFIGLGITGFYLKKINSLSQITAKTQDLFRQYSNLILAVENEKFQSKWLKSQQAKLISENQKASKAIKTFSKHIDALEQRQNMLVGFLLNALSLWDIRQCYKLESWLIQHQNKIKLWFDTMAFFDAYNSMANLAYNQTHFTFPELVENDSFILNCQTAAHPLIPKKQAVFNDFQINDESFLIITGANMAGKSTFLRTVSLMIVMANIGLPVCAYRCTYQPIKLITSMRTTDSLSSESSYFFSELSRLKTIVDHINSDKYFIVLDEILKGTNSHDKAKGSKQFVERLVKSKSTGIIATHDLSLCSLANELEEVENYYFDAEIVEGELYFDYKFKKGICKNMNASFLLKKMGIV